MIKTKDVYWQYFERKEHTAKICFSIFVACSFIILWFMFLSPHIYDVFRDHLVTTYTSEESKETSETYSFYAFAVTVWHIAMVPLTMFAVGFTTYIGLVLIECKRILKINAIEAIDEYRSYKESYYNFLSWMVVVILTSVFIPLLCLAPVSFSINFSLFALFFFTFLSISLFGLRNVTLDYVVAKQQKRYEKREAKKAAKEKAKEKVSKEKEVKKSQTFSVLLEERIQTNKVKQPEPFTEQIDKIINALRIIALEDDALSTENKHLIVRIVQEDIPAIVTSYHQLTPQDQSALHTDFMECFTNIEKKVTGFTDVRQDLNKLEAHKVLDIMKQRY